MANRPPDSKRIPEIKQVCFLENAIGAGFDAGHRFCIAYPVTYGLQAALVVAKSSSDGAINAGHTIDTLALIPRDVWHSDPVTGSIYGNYLGLVTHLQRKKIQRISGNELIRLWRTTSRTDPPFRDVTLARLTTEMKAFFSHNPAPITASGAVVALRAAWARSFRCVIPHVLDASAKKQSENAKQNWWILGRWSAWEDQRLDLYERFCAFRVAFPGPMPDDQTLSRTINTFRKRCCDFLRLNYTGRTNRKTARRRRNELRAERERREN